MRKIGFLVSLFSILVMTNSCEDSGSTSELENQIINHESDYESLVLTFEELLIPHHQVTVGNFDKSSYTLLFKPNLGNIADPSRTIGGNYLMRNSIETYLILAQFGWTEENIYQIERGLKKIGRDYISFGDEYLAPISIYDEPLGFDNCDISIYPKRNVEAAYEEFGEGLGGSDFLDRVYIHCSAAL